MMMQVMAGQGRAFLRQTRLLPRAVSGESRPLSTPRHRLLPRETLPPRVCPFHQIVPLSAAVSLLPSWVYLRSGMGW